MLNTIFPGGATAETTQDGSVIVDRNVAAVKDSGGQGWTIINEANGEITGATNGYLFIINTRGNFALEA